MTCKVLGIGLYLQVFLSKNGKICNELLNIVGFRMKPVSMSKKLFRIFNNKWF